MQRDLQPVSPELRTKYFEEVGNRFVFRPDLRRVVIFGRHDLVQDAPISRLDLLVCRNTLMYFNAETQSRILARFHFALNDTGVIFLGKAEMLLTRANLFNPVHLSTHLYEGGQAHVARSATGRGAGREPGAEQSLREPYPPTGGSL